MVQLVELNSLKLSERGGGRGETSVTLSLVITINVPLFKKLRDIGNFMYSSAVVYCCCVLLSVVGSSCVSMCVVVC